MSKDKILVHFMPGDLIEGYYYFTYRGVSVGGKLWESDRSDYKPSKREVLSEARKLSNKLKIGYECDKNIF